MTHWCRTALMLGIAKVLKSPSSSAMRELRVNSVELKLYTISFLSAGFVGSKPSRWCCSRRRNSRTTTIQAASAASAAHAPPDAPPAPASAPAASAPSPIDEASPPPPPHPLFPRTSFFFFCPYKSESFSSPAPSSASSALNTSGQPPSQPH